MDTDISRDVKIYMRTACFSTCYLPFAFSCYRLASDWRWDVRASHYSLGTRASANVRAKVQYFNMPQKETTSNWTY